MNLVQLNAGPKAPDGSAQALRDLADELDAGRVTSVVVACVKDGGFDFIYGASLADCLQMATLLQHRCIERFKL